MQYLRTEDGVNIAYATIGEGKPLVNLQPWAASFEQDWEHADGRAFLSGLAEGRMIVTFDRRGVGASEREVDTISLEQQLLDLRAVIDALGLEQFDLLGQEDGGTIAVAYAAENPERVSKLVLCWPIIDGADISSPEAAGSLADLMRNNWPLARSAMADSVFPSGPLERQKWVSGYWRSALSGETAAKYFEWYTSQDVRELAAKVKVPTLILHRRRQKTVPVRASRTAAALIPDAKLIVLDGDFGLIYADHETALEQIRQFLDEGSSETPAAPQPASGAVQTILFTDVEGSTALTQHLGDAKAQDVIRTHNSIVRDALTAHSGTEIKHTGDGIMASFTSASAALEAAVAIQKALAEHREDNADTAIRVRIGLNAGEPVVEDEDLFGTAVQLAARVCDKAEPGQILASNVVQELAAGKGFDFADQGEASLKGFEKPVRLHEVRWHD